MSATAAASHVQESSRPCHALLTFLVHRARQAIWGAGGALVVQAVLAAAVGSSLTGQVNARAGRPAHVGGAVPTAALRLGRWWSILEFGMGERHLQLPAVQLYRMAACRSCAQGLPGWPCLDSMPGSPAAPFLVGVTVWLTSTTHATQTHLGVHAASEVVGFAAPAGSQQSQRLPSEHCAPFGMLVKGSQVLAHPSPCCPAQAGVSLRVTCWIAVLHQAACSTVTPRRAGIKKAWETFSATQEQWLSGGHITGHQQPRRPAWVPP